MTRTAVIAQARTGSSRLPGKVLKRIGGKTVLEHVIRRARAVGEADVVCLATTTLAEDDEVARAAAALGAEVFRGASDDVLGRYRAAARAVRADVVMRLTCDCPLVDPAVCDAVLRLRGDEAADYASNVDAPHWPHGLDCEAFTFEALERAAGEASAAFDREHVTPWLRRHASLRTVALPGPGGAAGAHRWTLDYPEDLDFLEALFVHLPTPPAMPGWEEIAATVEAHPEIAAINRCRAVPDRLSAVAGWK